MRKLAFVACGLLVAGGLIAGCSSEKLDTSQGNFGKVDNSTTLPPQPDPAEAAKKRMASDGKPQQ